MCNYTPLHCHTMYSPDGIGDLDRLLDRAINIGISNLAITDHGTASGYMGFAKVCEERGINPLFGNEMYYRVPNIKERYHITVLALNNIGYKNIIKLDNATHQNIEVNTYGAKFPIMTLDMLDRYKEGLVVLTGCVQSRIFTEEYSDALHYTKQLIDILGDENIFLELMYVNHKDKFNNERIHRIHDDTKIPIVLTGDCHFANKEDAEIHQIGTTARKGYTYPSDDLYLKSYDEMIESATQHISIDSAKEYLENTNIIAERSEQFSVKNEPTLPNVTPQELEEFEQFLHTKFQPYKDKKEYNDEFNLELDVIKSKGFLPYFYIINDLKEFADRNNILVRLRGSGAGCLLFYLMGLSPIDPITYDLRFDRFLNYERDDFPDADLDFEANRRDEVLKYADERWGMKPIVALQTFSHKNLVQKLCIAFRKLFDVDIPFDLEMGARGGTDTLEWQKLIDTYPLFEKAYDVMFGQISHISKHAAAIAAPVTDCPIEGYGNEMALAWDKKDGESSGIVKVDILNVRNLDKIRSMIELSGVTIDPNTPFDDNIKAIFELGNTNGIFQMKSKLATELGKQIKPELLEHIIAIISLNRPGTIDAGTAELYAQYKENPRLIEPRIDKILKNTYGIILYQEDVMSVYTTVTNGNSALANRARKILCPKSPKVTKDSDWINQKNELKEIFYKDGKKNKFSKKILDFLWNEMKPHRRYSFNKSHGASYAYTAYEEAYYKAHYPSVYWTGLLRHTENSKKEAHKIQGYLIDAYKDGLKIIPPHVNISSFEYELEIGGSIITKSNTVLDNTFLVGDKKLYLPITLLKGIGADKCKLLYDLRIENNSFNSIEEFIQLTAGILNRRQRRHLFELGCLDHIDGNSGRFFFEEIDKLDKKLGDDSFDIITNRLFKTQKINNKDHQTLSSTLTSKQYGRILDSIELIKNYHTVTKRMLQKDYLGFVLPDDKTIALLNKYDGHSCIIAGWITEKKRKTTAKGNKIISYKMSPQNNFWEPTASMYKLHEQRVERNELQHNLNGGNNFTEGTFIVVQKDINKDGSNFGMLAKFLILED